MRRILVATRVGAPCSVLPTDEPSPTAWGHDGCVLEGTHSGRVEGRRRAVLVGQYARNPEASSGECPQTPARWVQRWSGRRSWDRSGMVNPAGSWGVPGGRTAFGFCCSCWFCRAAWREGAMAPGRPLRTAPLPFLADLAV